RLIRIMQISIRKATIHDMAAVHQLVQELANYEKAPDEVITSPNSYQQDYQNNAFECIVAVNSSDKILGTCIFYETFSTWKGKMMWLEDFVVNDAQRGQGIGAKLFEYLIEESKRRKLVLMKWQIIDWNEPALNFYSKYNFIKEDNWFNGKIFFEPKDA
ncbi:MAG: GNAT family N-acetyltransferase, partial [Bacteroidota bacterium]